MLVKGFYRQPACLLLCVCACCLSGFAELLGGQQCPGEVLWAGTRSWASQQEPCPGLPALLRLLLSRSTQAFLAPRVSPFVSPQPQLGGSFACCALCHEGPAVREEPSHVGVLIPSTSRERLRAFQEEFGTGLL